MSQLQITLLLYRIAADNNVSYQEVYGEIKKLIEYAYSHQTPESKPFWDKFSENTTEPSVHQVLKNIL